jgi:hypothetical protein
MHGSTNNGRLEMKRGNQSYYRNVHPRGERGFACPIIIPRLETMTRRNEFHRKRMTEREERLIERKDL